MANGDLDLNPAHRPPTERRQSLPEWRDAVAVQVLPVDNTETGVITIRARLAGCVLLARPLGKLCAAGAGFSGFVARAAHGGRLVKVNEAMPWANTRALRFIALACVTPLLGCRAGDEVSRTERRVTNALGAALAECRAAAKADPVAPAGAEIAELSLQFDSVSKTFRGRGVLVGSNRAGSRITNPFLCRADPVQDTATVLFRARNPRLYDSTLQDLELP
jgi:hypothetical protein